MAKFAPTRFPLLGLFLLATYAAHLAEERWGGPGFPAWAERVAGVHLSVETWLALNAIFFGVLAAGVAAGWIHAPAQWLLIPLGTAVMINGLLHLASSAITRTYSPGVVTGALLWVPLGIAIIRAAHSRWGAAHVRAGIGLGVLLHLGVTLSAYSSTLPR